MSKWDLCQHDVLRTDCEQGCAPASPPPAATASARAGEAFAKYHAEHAAYGGAGWEFHARAETYLLNASAEIAALRAERDEWKNKAEAYHDSKNGYREQMLSHGKEIDRLRAEVARLTAERDEAIAAIGATVCVECEIQKQAAKCAEAALAALRGRIEALVEEEWPVRREQFTDVAQRWLIGCCIKDLRLALASSERGAP